MAENTTPVATINTEDINNDQELTWTWRIESNDFSIEQDVINKRCGTDKTIKSIEDFIFLFSSKDKDKLVDLIRSAHEGSSPEPIQTNLVHKDLTATLCTVSATKLSKDIVAGCISFLSDLPPLEELFSITYQFYENAHHGFIITDENTRVITCNAYFEKASGYKLADLVGKKTKIFNARKHSDDFFDNFWKSLEFSNYWSGLILSKSRSGKIVPQELSVQKIKSIQGKVYYIGMTKDLSKKLYRLAGKEHGGIELLTQLPSDTEYKENVAKMYDKLPQSCGLMVLCFTLELENDTEHDYKKKIASALSSLPDNYTTAGFLGGNAFSISIYYKRSADKPHSLSIFETIKGIFQLIRNEVEPELYDLVSQTTIGTSVLGLDSSGPGTLVSHALQAMYEKHSHNNNNICFYNRTLHEKVKKRESLELITTEAIKNKDVEVYFQPILSSENWRIKKFEALCRFKDADKNILNTQKIIKIAEDLNLISELDLVIAEKTIASRKALAAIYGKDIELTINISLASSKPLKRLFSDLCQLLEKYQSDIPYITIELTESSYFNSEDTDAELLFELRTKGVKVAIDDFGTGYSSFAYLKDSNFDLLKIDREFVQDITVGSHNYYIVKMITNLAHTLGVEVVAEGVESLQEIVILKDLKVDLMQGYYFSKPKPIDELDPYSKYARKLRDLKSCDNENEGELFIHPPTITAENNLSEIKEIFDNCHFSTLPVLAENRCVGYIDREIFQLHCSPSLGTDTETTQDLRSLSKPVSAMMATKITKVHETINSGEIHEKIRNNYAFPWIAIDDYGNYIALIDSNSMISYLNAL